MSNLPMALVDSDGFRYLIDGLVPLYVIPGKKSNSNNRYILPIYNNANRKKNFSCRLFIAHIGFMVGQVEYAFLHWSYSSFY